MQSTGNPNFTMTDAISHLRACVEDYSRNSFRRDVWEAALEYLLKLPPASETATPLPSDQSILAPFVTDIDDAGTYILQLDIQKTADLWKKTDALQLALAAATRELEERRAQIDNQGAIIRTSVMPASDREKLMLAELAALRSDLLLARQQGEEMRKALERIRALKPQNMAQDYWSKKDGLEPDDVFDICAAALAATPSPQGNNQP